jgi:hypothetical protein
MAKFGGEGGGIPLETQYNAGLGKTAKTSESTKGQVAGEVIAKKEEGLEITKGPKVVVEEGGAVAGKERMLSKPDVSLIYKELDKKYAGMDVDEMELQLALREEESEEKNRIFEKARGDLERSERAAAGGDKTVAAILKAQRAEYEEEIAKVKREAEIANIEVGYLQGLISVKKKIEKAA